MKRWIGVVALGLALSGCGDPKLDGSSEAAFRQSASEVRASLDSERQEEFNQALLRLTMQDVDLGSLMTQDPESMIQGGISKLDGLTAVEVLQQDREQQERQGVEEVASMREELADLESKLEEMGRAEENLERFVVIDSFFRHEGQGLERRPLVNIRVRNDTGRSISRVYFAGTVRIPERATPWISDTFNYDIPGGVEPGETTSWVLELNRNDWATEVPELNYLTLDVLRLDGPHGEVLWEEESLSRYEEIRLEQIREALDT
jgi:hypothetical protein